MSVEQRVIEIVCEHLAVNKETVTRNTAFIEDIGADSLDIVELVMELEEEFDIQIPDDQAEKKPARKRRPARVLTEWVAIVAVALVLALAARQWVFQTFSIPSESM